MNIFDFNVRWMVFNLLLAAYALLFCWLFFRVRHKVLKILFFILWALYVPNTIYIFLDLTHLLESWTEVADSEKLFLLSQYAIFEGIGLTLFILAFAPFERALLRTKLLRNKTIKYTILIGFNYLLGFAMVLGRVERINSWEVFTNPARVINSTIAIFTSWELIGLILLLGTFTNCFYFLFRKPVSRVVKRVL